MDANGIGLSHRIRGRDLLTNRMKEAAQMSEEKNTKGCEHPEKLKGKPEDCTPEQKENVMGMQEYIAVALRPGPGRLGADNHRRFHPIPQTIHLRY